MSIRILIVDDHEIVRYGLRELICKESDFEVIGEAENGRTAVELADQLKPQIVIMDITMPDLNGFEATQKIKKKIPDVKIIALSMHKNKRFVVDMLKAGISGYVHKAKVQNDLIQAIRTAMQGEVYLSPQIGGLIAEDYRNPAQKSGELSSVTLTHREREILQLIAEGKST